MPTFPSQHAQFDPRYTCTLKQISKDKQDCSAYLLCASLNWGLRSLPSILVSDFASCLREGIFPQVRFSG